MSKTRGKEMLKLCSPAVLSAMAGVTDGAHAARAAKSGAGMVTLGGFNFDKATLGAARLSAARGRSEFTIDLEELPEYIERQVSIAREGKTLVSINVRVASRDGLLLAAKLSQAADADAIELNAHCRQPEIVNLGTGQALLKSQKKLCQWITTLKNHIDIPLIVKIRANIVDEVALVRKIIKAGADVIHVDAMKPGVPYADLDVIKKISASVDTFLIGNNSVKDVHTAIQMLKAGANAFSIARAAINNPEIVGKIGRIIMEKRTANFPFSNKSV